MNFAPHGVGWLSPSETCPRFQLHGITIQRIKTTCLCLSLVSTGCKWWERGFKQEIMKDIIQSYRLDSVGHLGHIYVQVRARVSLQRSIKQLLANQLLFRASYVTSCTCSTSNGNRTGSHQVSRKRRPLVRWGRSDFQDIHDTNKSWRISPSTDYRWNLVHSLSPIYFFMNDQKKLQVACNHGRTQARCR